jgi:hypothetical protein
MAATVADLGARVLRRLGIAAVAAADRPSISATMTIPIVAVRALMLLGVIAADEDPSPPDLALGVEKAVVVHESLVAHGLVPWAETAIPRSVSDEYVRLTAMHLAPSFGKTVDPAMQEVIEGRIRRVALLIRAPDLAEQAVLDVHAALDARGKTRWTCFDIPDFVEAPYVLMAANLLAPQFGLPQDPAANVWAMRELAQVIALGSNDEPIRAEYF